MKHVHDEILKIRTRRRALKITQGVLAAESGISKPSIAQMECGAVKRPAYDTIQALLRTIQRLEADPAYCDAARILGKRKARITIPSRKSRGLS